MCFMKNSSFSNMMLFLVHVKQNVCEFQALLILFIRKINHKHNTLKILLR